MMQDIICYRIDDRLIHGQVAAVWTRHLKQTRIVVVDDEANGSDLQKQMLRLACPQGIKLSVLSIAKAVKNFTDGKYNGDKIMVISKSPQTVIRLMEAGFAQFMPKEIIVGNMSGSREKRQLAKGFNVDDNDVEAIRRIEEQGVEVYYQLLPQNPKERVEKLLPGGGRDRSI